MDPKKALGNFIRLNQSYWEIIGILESKEEGLKNKETQSLPLLPFEFLAVIFMSYLPSEMPVESHVFP